MEDPIEFQDDDVDEVVEGNRQERRALNKRLNRRQKKQHKKTEDQEIQYLTKRIEEGAPAKGTNPLAETVAEDESDTYYYKATKFEELPLSTHTKQGLAKNGFTILTEIQRAALPHALCGRDILGAAKTGSGKTLAFVIPTIEKLYRMKWTKDDGLGALIISPTRELALQTFEVLKKVGFLHSLSAGLVIGGKDLEYERERIQGINILVATPGRLLQHMDETTGFEASNLQVLVLDEADRILDLGFERTMNAIIDNLPKVRQTMLFSATQTKSVRDLARLSLKDPEYISVHEKSEFSTPQKLIQHVIFCELQEKLDTIYGFIRTHLKSKIVIFFASCKQVRFVYESFRKLRPGIPLSCMHGKQKQIKRMEIFSQFCKSKNALLFATDLAARGLDFPAVDWVVQADCPDDVATYIHRVGRTARYESGGCSLLLLLPSEKHMVTLLEQHKVPIKILKINPNEKKISIQKQLSSLLSSTPELNYLAQKAFISYMRSVWLQSNKEVFKVEALPAAEFAQSLGLPLTPNIKFTKTIRKDKNNSQHESAIETKMPPEESQPQPKKPTKTERVFKRKNMAMEAWSKLVDKPDASDDDDIFKVKRANHDLDLELEDGLQSDNGGTISQNVTTSTGSTKRKAEHPKETPKPKQIKVAPKTPLSLEEQEEVALAILRKQTTE